MRPATYSGRNSPTPIAVQLQSKRIPLKKRSAAGIRHDYQKVIEIKQKNVDAALRKTRKTTTLAAYYNNLGEGFAKLQGRGCFEGLPQAASSIPKPAASYYYNAGRGC